jgi:hypothetical protein
MTFQENPKNGNRERDEKVLCFESKVPFITDWSGMSSRAVQGMRRNREAKCCRKIPPKEAETQKYSFFVLQVRCSSLFTVSKQTYFVNSPCVKNVMYNAAGWSLLWKLRKRQKCALFLKKSGHQYWPIATKPTSFLAHAWKIGDLKFKKDPGTERKGIFSPKWSDLFCSTEF